MIDYYDNISGLVPQNALNRYCKDEGLDYLYTAAAAQKKRQTSSRGSYSLKNCAASVNGEQSSASAAAHTLRHK